MNPTKNVRYIEVENDIFQLLCENKFDEKVREVQNKYQQLEKKLSEKITRWMKLKDKDCYFETKCKVLFPETRNMKLTDVRFGGCNSYEDVLVYLDKCDEETLKNIKENVEKSNKIVPSKHPEELEGFKAIAITKKMADELFDDRTCPCITDNGLVVSIGGPTNNIIMLGLSYSIYCISNGQYYGCNSVNLGALNLFIHEFDKQYSPFEILVKYGLYLEKFDEKENSAIAECHNIVSNHIDMEDFDKLKSYLKHNKVANLLGVDLRSEAIENDMEAEYIDMHDSTGAGAILNCYLNTCDYIRARIQKYDSKWYLSDEEKGHWELWSEEKYQEDVKIKDCKKEKVQLEKIEVEKRVLSLKDGVIARNPLADVKHNAVVGIDFGTKSTIVALQDGDEQIIPLRVGMADYSVAPEVSHFENPTVMQFTDMSQFIKQYNKLEGRPMTSWDDLRISHEAFENLIGAEKSIDMASFVSDIKQWASGKYKNKNSGHLIIRDATGCRYDIDNYMELTKEDIDLVEIYAYYIGLFINNMHMGIHLDYIMSFPETFSKEIREHILNSFTKGIKKSIPPAVLEDGQCATEFRVRQGPSEPAAYAACALEQYGIEPTNDGVFYGIFDFGGGTTDYDYGIWKNAPEDEYTYNYVIKHYGSGGDRTLGGENILQLLAYNVYSDSNKSENGISNLDIMRKNNIVYYRPVEGITCSGAEGLNNSSESAMLNTKLMMEALRPIWEEWKEVQDWFASDKKNTLELSVGAKNVSVVFNADKSVKTKLALFCEQGKVEVVLNIDMAMVNQVINDRIETGVRNFFEGLVGAYAKLEKTKNEKIHLFLAGNSSKSKRVMRFFEEYVIIYNNLIFGEDITELGSNDEMKEVSENQEEEDICFMNNVERSHFIVYPPLGTEVARKIQKSRKIDVKLDDLMSPTGKTGVAFGLVMCREGSMIKVESEVKKSEQIKTNYYIGVNYRKNFKLIFDRIGTYGKWMKFSKIAANTETFEFYYSELPEVTGNDITIKDNKSIYKRKCLVDNVTTDAFIFFRFITPTQLEYVVALEDKIEMEEYISEIYTVNL